LSFITKRLLTEPKILVNTRIVVVGASATGIAFIQNLLFTPYLSFSNIMLVSHDGFGDGEEEDKDVTRMRPVDEDFPSKGTLVALGLHHRVRVAAKEMVELDRSSKAIVLDDDTVVPYDVLILTSGRADASVKNMEGEGEGVDGVFFLTGPSGEAGALNACDMLTDADNICVYGNALEALTAVQGMLDKGIKGRCITYVGSHNLGDSGMNETMIQALQDAGVTHIPELTAVEILSDEDQCLTGLKCVDKTDGSEVIVSCRMLVFGDKWLSL
jgi:hypothetical protein